MLEFFSIFSKGGIVLWLFQFTETHVESHLNVLVTNILEGKSSSPILVDKNMLEYKINNNLDIVIAACYNKILELPYVRRLINEIENKFFLAFQKESPFANYQSFDEIFLNNLHRLENEFRGSSLSISKKQTISEPIISTENHIDENHSTNGHTQPKNTEVTSDSNMKDLELSPKQTKKKGKKGKEARNWGDKITKEDADVLDYSAKISGNINNYKNHVKPDLNKKIDSLIDSQKNFNTDTFVFKYFKGLFGEKTITHVSLKPAMDKIKEHLFSKNVAVDIAEKVCKSVSEQMLGKSFTSASNLNSILYSSMEIALTNIITPKRNINLLDLVKNNRNNRPFVVVFCGVNGVGKSTNLAKVAYHLLSNGERVLIAACDTFRSGAVEQLRTHVSRFNSMFATDSCILYEKGYGKDSSGVAAEAIKIASNQKYSVVLVDTAGRMQNNEPLMRSLAKLISQNEPDLVLFVGEALVGNDGVNQLVEFNRHLSAASSITSNNIHQIDGIILTKFDTIDDKVGAVLSMTYITGQPIVFVGVGQTYKDLRILDVKSAVELLLK